MALPKINDFTVTELVDMEAYYRNTGILDFLLTELQEMSIEATQEKTAMTGKGGRTINYKKRNKAITGTGTSAVISAGLMKAQTGGDITYGTHIVKQSEYKKVDGATLTTDQTATGTAGDEIGEIKVVQKGSNAVIATYTQALTADANHFSYNPATKTITLPNSSGTPVIEDGAQLLYAYEREVSGTKVNDPSGKFSEVREIWIHCFGTDACDNEYYAAIHIPRADFSGDFTFDLGGDQTVHNFSFDALTDLCDPSADSDLFELIIYNGEVGGVQGQYSIEITTPLATGDSVTISGIAYDYDSSATTAAAQAAAIYSLLNASSAVTDKYTLARSGALITFTETFENYGVGAPVVDTTSLTTGTIVQRTIRQGEAE